MKSGKLLPLRGNVRPCVAGSEDFLDFPKASRQIPDKTLVASSGVDCGFVKPLTKIKRKTQWL